MLISQVTGDSVVNVACVVVVGLIGYSVKQSIGRITDRVTVVAQDVTKLSDRLDADVDEVCGDLQDHKVRCHETTNAVLASKLEVVEKEVASLRRFSHWVSSCLYMLFAHSTERIPPRND